MGVISAILSAISGIRNLITQIINGFNALESWILSLFGDVSKNISSLAHDIDNFMVYELNYTQWLYGTLLQNIADLQSRILSWTAQQINSLGIDIVNAYHAAENDLAKALTLALNAINALKDWVENEVLGPLSRLITGITQWIETAGAYMFDLLSHPEKLAILVGKYLLLGWLGYTRKLAPPFFKWLYHSAISTAPDLTGILEDIISSLFD